jgi:glycosyltransferase involved in cell wall biosynthesis
VGAIIPRKNIARLFEAFDVFKQQDSSNTKLLIVGNRKWWTSGLDKVYKGMKYRDDVIFLGRMNALELNSLYAASVALTFVPYFEGFGIPILEAFNSGTAVITSNTTSMPEVAGDAALLVDPFSVESIADAMIRLNNNKELRDELILKGKHRAENFSWDKTAKILWQSIEKVLH